jgi:hypothetical protein
MRATSRHCPLGGSAVRRRSDKLQEISAAEVRSRQQSRLTAKEYQVLFNLQEQALRGSRKRGQVLAPSALSESLEYAKDHLFERISVPQAYDLLAEALQHRRGQVDLGELRAWLQAKGSHGALLRCGSEVATQESLERERTMIQS